ncbi:MAG TPA: hypothetical protein VHM91_17320 [Verrucomicrobiales bacterium]|nr:hypothetical protein [Verrucomicrobiales bacterium]
MRFLPLPLLLAALLASPGAAQDKPSRPAKGKPAPAAKDKPAQAPKDKTESPSKEKPAPGSEKETPKGPAVPDDMLEDEHLREEYGVNEYTTPSIRKIFGQLDKLGALPYDKLKREIPKGTSPDRTMVSLSLGVLIGDGFLSAQSEKIEDLESIGRAVLRHAKVLAAGARITEHAKAILENSALGDWKTLREDLSATQKDVESEMVLLRDVEMAHFISIGGWLRGLEIASTAALDPFTPERASVLARKDLAEYFSATLADIAPQLKKLPHIKALHTGIDEIRALLDLPEGKPFEKDQVQKIHDKAAALVQLITTVKP